MLVVVTIMMMLLAAAATRMRPANDARRVREAARALGVYLSTARNRAMETGRPCGVILHRFTGATAAVMSLDQCEVPPTYAGDTTGATMQVTVSGSTVTTTTTSGFTNTLVANGDLIQFNGQGPYYTITDRTGGGGTGVTATFDTSQGQLVPWPSVSPGISASYRISRLPSSTNATTFKGQAQSLQLPASTVVDLAGSGIDSAAAPFNQFTAGGADVGIVFSSNGSIYGVYFVNGTSTNVTAPIYLLVGKRDRVGNTYTAGNTNLDTQTNDQDLTNLWIVVNPQTGLVTCGEVGADNGTRFSGSRALARDQQSMGGK
jgi:type II secretory pathway pseudopilin PulG